MMPACHDHDKAKFYPFLRLSMPICFSGDDSKFCFQSLG
ncbi:Hypothetical protein Minf_1785 [Methylacidiphilum infernorum V4]|uniref:Uncharacterized protein n=1 Tax=Methylacidiphilum infernorum (isolate V4) TaxID=481448 RepID=B3DXD0_METI4|nr:Hypothetical protein Minf_1785 [Methylacidiphilum infernorum V4]